MKIYRFADLSDIYATLKTSCLSYADLVRSDQGMLAYVNFEPRLLLLLLET